MAVVYTGSAPGKLLLTGEYAVLAGAPAISAAVDLRASATVQAASGSASELHITNTGERYVFQLAADGAMHWPTDPGAQASLLQAALIALRASGQGEMTAVKIELCTRKLYAADGQKIGVGSSAALTVALTAALQKFLGSEPEFATSLHAHRIFQGGAGSGVDVATSWYGGVISMQPGSTADAPPLVTRLHWPVELHVAPVWTGVAASTTQLLARLKAFREAAPLAYEAQMTALTQVSRAVLKHWRDSETATLLLAIQDCGQALRKLDEAGQIGIWSAPHQQLAELAQAEKIVYKPSGAGGGDFGLAFAQDPQQLARFVKQAEERVGRQTHGIEWSAAGLVCNATAG